MYSLTPIVLLAILSSHAIAAPLPLVQSTGAHLSSRGFFTDLTTGFKNAVDGATAGKAGAATSKPVSSVASKIKGALPSAPHPAVPGRAARRHEMMQLHDREDLEARAPVSIGAKIKDSFQQIGQKIKAGVKVAAGGTVKSSTKPAASAPRPVAVTKPKARRGDVFGLEPHMSEAMAKRAVSDLVYIVRQAQTLSPTDKAIVKRALVNRLNSLSARSFELDERASSIGGSIKTSFQKVGQGVKAAGGATGAGVKTGTTAVGSAVKSGAQAIGGGVAGLGSKIASALGNLFGRDGLEVLMQRTDLFQVDELD
ncbi:hypothetical protein DL93DRAFT_307868 [Clavulina sp. PMI_390]|nr:hypothetical protein DL93DRAFT_307868 [Clavulina sp. PMI_390]